MNKIREEGEIIDYWHWHFNFRIIEKQVQE